MTKLIYVGNYKYPWTTETHCANSFESIGCEVIRLQENELKRGDLVKAIDEHKPDFVLYTKTWNAEVDWEKAKEKVTCVSWCLDLYVGLDREHQLKTNPFFDNHIVITPDGGHQEEFRQAGVNHYFVKAGVYDKGCYLGTPREEYKKDIIFVGSYKHYHGEWTHRQALVNYLIKTYGDRFDWHPKGECIREKDLNDLYASVKIVVGDSLYSPYYWSDRIYETTGRGGFLIHPKIEGLEDEFEYGKHIIGYNYFDFEGLKKKIDYYLTHDEEREKIRKAGHELVKTRCNYKVRCQEVLDIIKEYELRNS